MVSVNSNENILKTYTKHCDVTITNTLLIYNVSSSNFCTSNVFLIYHS